jgi:phage terminase small subunit
MAGVKGRSGSGGARPGAGRPRKERPEPALTKVPEGSEDDPLAYLIAIMQDSNQDPRLRVRAAVAAAQYTHVKKGDGGKKDERADAAKRVAGKFVPAVTPRLVVDNTKAH